MPLPAALAHVSGAAVTSIRWKGEGSEVDRESEPAGDCRSETREGVTKTSRTRRYGRSRTARC